MISLLYGRSVTLTFDEGENYKSLDFAIFDDDLPEATESFRISLSEPVGGAEINPDLSSVLISILYNDNAHGIIQFSEVCLLLFLYLFWSAVAVLLYVVMWL